jgi:hypothetical protein
MLSFEIYICGHFEDLAVEQVDLKHALVGQCCAHHGTAIAAVVIQVTSSDSGSTLVTLGFV